MKPKLIAILSLIMFNISCSKESKLNDSNLLLGIWESEKYETMDGKSIYVFSRSEKLNKTISIIFEGNDVFKSWDSGWCGTPPLQFSTYVGTYELENNVLKVEINAFTNINGELEIIELTSDTLKLMKL